MPSHNPVAAVPAGALLALQDLYARVDALIAARSPRCELSGRCCDFPTSGHRLYASDLETDFSLGARGSPLPAAASGLCPWFAEGRCRNRGGRPLACRVYFCDPAWEDEMPAVYEGFHAELRQIHDRFGLRYSYRLFVDAVRERHEILRRPPQP